MFCGRIYFAVVLIVSVTSIFIKECLGFKRNIQQQKMVAGSSPSVKVETEDVNAIAFYQESTSTAASNRSTRKLCPGVTIYCELVLHYHKLVFTYSFITLCSGDKDVRRVSIISWHRQRQHKLTSNPSEQKRNLVILAIPRRVMYIIYDKHAHMNHFVSMHAHH